MKLTLGLLIIFLVIGGIIMIKSSSKSPLSPVTPKTVTEVILPEPKSTTPSIAPTKIISYQATLKTDSGDIVIKLNDTQTPKTVQNFLTLAQKGFYNNTIFHRVIEGFMIQGGDPKGDGTGGPGYKFADEPFTGEYNRGTVAMANAGPNTNGSQFFIMHQNNPLPKNYVIFGQVVSGLEVVDKIATASVSANLSGEQSKPLTPVKIQSVLINEFQ